MDIEYPELIPDSSLSKDGMMSLQREVSEKAVFEDGFDFRLRDFDDILIAGVDQAFLDDRVISGIVVMSGEEVVERAHAVTPIPMPYVPGLLVFREGEPMIDGFNALSSEPDLLFFDGNGRIHFREAGIATHIGLLFDVPSLGVAKNLLCGTPKSPLDEPMEEGTRVPLLGEGDTTASENEVIGYVYQSRQYSSSKVNVNPIYVSSGHRIGAETATDFVEMMCDEFKLPETIRLADKYVDEVKSELRN